MEIIDEKDLLIPFLRNLYSIDPCLKDDYEVKEFGPYNHLISENCQLPLVIKSLEIPADFSLAIPEISHSLINRLKTLEYLSLPLPFFEEIENEIVFDNLKGLRFNLGNPKISKEIVMKKLRYISTDNTLTFHPESFPALEMIRYKYDTKILDKLAEYRDLICLALSSFNEETIRPLTIFNNLKTLYIDRGNLQDISAIDSVKGLRRLYLKNLKFIKDLTPLIGLKHLEYLQIGYCNQIVDWNFLLELKKLRYLSLSFAKPQYLPQENILEKLRQRGVKIV